MAKVYIVQENPKRNVLGAAKFGELEVILPPREQIVFATAPTVRLMRKKLENYCDDDYLIAMGDPVAIAIDSKLKIITRIGEKVVEKKKVIAKIEAEVKLAREQLRKIVEEELPDAMTSVNLKYFELIDGTEFSVKEEIFVSITEDKRAGALKWLEVNGHGDLIKHDVKVSFR